MASMMEANSVPSFFPTFSDWWRSGCLPLELQVCFSNELKRNTDEAAFCWLDCDVFPFVDAAQRTFPVPLILDRFAEDKPGLLPGKPLEIRPLAEFPLDAR